MKNSKPAKFSLASAEAHAKAIVKKLSPYCKNIEVAGSIRRRRPRVNDIDIVLIPSDTWNLNNEIMSLCRPFKPKATGKKIMRLDVGMYPVDIYFADDSTWATLLLIRTGSTANNIRLCKIAKEMGWHLHANGAGLFNQYGKRMAGDSEASIYETLGLPFQNPQERD